MTLVDSYVQPYGGGLPFDYLNRLDACESYVPTAEGLQLVSNGHIFYSAERLSHWVYPIQSSLAFGSETETAITFHLTEPAPPTETLPSIQSPTCSPHALVTPPSPSQVTQLSGSQPTLSDDEVRSIIEHYIRTAPWFREHAHEPLVGGYGVPSCALQLAPTGESIYRCFVVPGKPKKNKPTFKCATCEFVSDRLHRVIGHQRVKRGHKPFTCQDAGCEFHGPTKESLGDHRSSRNNATSCQEW